MAKYCYDVIYNAIEFRENKVDTVRQLGLCFSPFRSLDNSSSLLPVDEREEETFRANFDD